MEKTYTAEQLALRTHLIERSQSLNYWILEDPTNRGGCGPITDIDHWISCGINTIEDLHRDDELIQAKEDRKNAMYEEYELARQKWEYENTPMPIEALPNSSFISSIGAMAFA